MHSVRSPRALIQLKTIGTVSRACTGVFSNDFFFGKIMLRYFKLAVFVSVIIQGRIQDLIGGPQIVTGLNCRWCAVASCERSEPFCSVGSGAHLRVPEALGYFITKYAFSPFWGTFLYYF